MIVEHSTNINLKPLTSSDKDEEACIGEYIKQEVDSILPPRKS